MSDVKDPPTSTPLHHALQDLHRELSSTKTLDNQSQELLETVLRDIQRALDAHLPEHNVEPVQSDVIDKLEETALSFEMRHPQLAAGVQTLVDLLRKAGI
ncbi:MAG: DUF4404 family protein [Deltaproteobacteria bacterium]|nr:DUF4404 family protein [Deltaproteobacteria bacterium]